MDNVHKFVQAEAAKRPVAKAALAELEQEIDAALDEPLPGPQQDQEGAAAAGGGS